MKITFGFAAHSGWAALVIVGGPLEQPEKDLNNYSVKALAIPLTRVQTTLTQLGKSIGPPWTKDQKDATLAAMIALHGKPL